MKYKMIWYRTLNLLSYERQGRTRRQYFDLLSILTATVRQSVSILLSCLAEACCTFPMAWENSL